MYDPNAQRWLYQDPEGFAAGDMNLYRFVGNAPTDGRDPSGLSDQREEQSKTLSTGQAIEAKYGKKAEDLLQGIGRGTNLKGDEIVALRKYVDLKIWMRDNGRPVFNQAQANQMNARMEAIGRMTQTPHYTPPKDLDLSVSTKLSNHFGWQAE